MLKIRKSNPGLYHSMMVFGVMDITLGLNFFFSTPTFDPYGIPKIVPAMVFTILGVGQLLSLNAFHNLKMARIITAISLGFMFFWGLGNTQQFFDGKASLQLPILYVSLSILQVLSLIESPVNRMTERE